MRKVGIVGAGLMAAVVLGSSLLLAAVGGLGPSNSDRGLLGGSLCATHGPIRGLTAGAAENGRIVAAVASARGGQRAALIALMSGLTESGLRILSNPHDPAGDRYPSQGVGYDHDSLGIFQQRPQWGSAAQRMDPVMSTNLFLDRLFSLPDWPTAVPWLVAQQVQQSAFADGSNYRAHAAQAEHILTGITADAARLDCDGSGSGSTPGGRTNPYGLPLRYTIPAGTSAAATAAVTFALDQLGKPYEYGATGPGSYDCSGLTQTSWAAAGVSISRTTSTQARDGTPTTAAQLAPGDLVLVPGADGTLASPGHVGMFIGWGLVVEAPHTGDVVRVVTYSSFLYQGLSALRHVA
jgi:cell wall-associated NlpC family hydrolase